MRRPDGLVLRSGQFACPVTLRTGLRHQGIWELGRFWAIGESPRPDWRVRVAKMGLGLSKTATDGRYRNSGSRTSWSSRGSARSRSESSDAGGDLAVANVRSGPSHKPPTIAALWCLRRIFSTTSRWPRSMKLMIFIFDPQWGHSSGSTSNTRLTRAAQLEAVPLDLACAADRASSTSRRSIFTSPFDASLARMPRWRYEYQPKYLTRCSPLSGMCCVSSARKSSASKTWKLRLAPPAKSLLAGVGKRRQSPFCARYTTDPDSVTRTILAKLNGQRTMYSASRCNPDVSQAGK